MASNNGKQERLPSGTSLVLYGFDEGGKPRAACFAAKDAVLAKKAAGLMGLSVLPVANQQQIEIAAKLPLGRLYSSGRGLVPNVRAALYEKLIAAAGGVAVASQTSSNAEGQEPGLKQNSKAASAHQLPTSWDAIDVGHVVIVQEAEKVSGWSEATVVQKSGDMFTLRWQAPPNKKLITRHRLNLALLCPNGQVDAGSKGSMTTDGVSPPKAASNKPATAQEVQAGQEILTDWNEIDVGHVVLAKEDGPLQGWWEAVVTTKEGDALTLQWRDYASLPTIFRQCSKLGLICPTALGVAQSA
jgi:hypothetical protein